MAIHDGTNCITKLRTSNDIISTVTDKASCISNIIYKQANAPFTNLVNNGDFSNGTTGWAANGGTCTISASGGILKATGNGTAQYIIVGQTYSTAAVINHKYYFAVTAQYSDRNVQIFMLRPYVSNQVDAQFRYMTLDTWNRVSMIATSNKSGSLSLYMWTQYASGSLATASYLVKEVLTTDLTATYGAGNEPTQAQMDHNINKVWIDTTNENTPKKFGGGGWTTF